MAVKATFSGLDYSKEGTKTGVYMEDLTAVNFAAQVTLLGNLQAAIQGVSLIAYDGTVYPAAVVDRETTPPAATEAQREIKWRVSYSDDVNGRVGSFEIGGADTNLLVLNSDQMDLSAGAGLALVTAIEADAISRDGNAITVTGVRLVGRNN